MNIKDKRLFEQMDTIEQGKYIKDISEIMPDLQDKLEEYEITYKPINILKKIKKAVDESYKEKASDPTQGQSATQEQ